MEVLHMEKTEKKVKEGIQLTIIEAIEALMDENKINQATLAREIDIGQAQLSKCLNRKCNNYFSIDTLIRLSDYFKVPVDQLLGRSSIRASEEPGSNADICRHLVSLIESNTVNIVSVGVAEDTYQPVRDEASNRTDSYRYEKKKNSYKMFYFSNFLPFPDMKSMNKTEKKEMESRLSSNGLYYPKRIEINAFIEYYLKLRDLYKNDDLPRAFFEQAIEDRLNQMRY